MPKKVESLHQAIVYLGNQAIKTWVTLIALSGIDDKPHELMTVALVRAKMCELLAERLNLPNKDSYFITGLFSTLDAMMDAPLDQLVENLPLTAINGARAPHYTICDAPQDVMVVYRLERFP